MIEQNQNKKLIPDVGIKLSISKLFVCVHPVGCWEIAV